MYFPCICNLLFVEEQKGECSKRATALSKPDLTKDTPMSKAS